MKKGTTIDHYKILEKLGEGGMGVVYKARDTKLDRVVALKFLSSHLTASKEDRQRLIREARAAAGLNHPNICTIYSVSEYEDSQFIVMECIEGETLRSKLDKGTLELNTSLDYIVQITGALTEAHDAGIIHRDLKPGNIMINNKGRIKITDFGLAKLSGSSNLTKTGTVLGTVAYMSPEQIRGGEVDERTDLFSLGVIFYEMMTGVHPFKGEYEQAIGFKLLNEDPELLRSIRSDIPEGLEDIVMRCLEKDPENRYGSTRTLQMALDEEIRWPLQKTGTSVSPKKLGLRGFFFFNRNTGFWTVSTGILVLALGILLLSSFFLDDSSEERIPGEKHLVVLPFNNLSKDIIPATLNDGIVEILTSKITQMEMHQGNLWVVPSTEVREGEVSSVTEASRQFGANMAVTGSVQGDGERFRLTINLVDGNTVRQLRSEMLEIEWTDFARLQDEVVHTLIEMLELELGEHDVQNIMAGSSMNHNAYQQYLEGHGHLSRFENPEQIDSAIRLFERAIDADPGYAHAHAGLAEAYWRKFELTRDTEWARIARNYGGKALEINDQMPEVYITLALMNNGMGRFEEALEMLDNLEELYRLSYKALIERGRAYEGIGLLDKAEETYLNAIEKKRSYWGGYHRLGVFYFKNKRLEEATEIFRKVTELTPDNARAFNNLGGTYLAMGNTEEAIDAFERSMDLQPNHRALTNLGTLYFYQKNYSEAIRIYEQAIKVIDTDYRIWGDLGHAYYRTGEDSAKVGETMRKAIELAEREREIRPNDPELLGQLAGYHITIGNIEEGRKLIDRLTSLEVLDPETISGIVHLYERLGERDSALYWVEELLRNGHRINILEKLEDMQDLMKDPRMKELRMKYKP